MRSQRSLVLALAFAISFGALVADVSCVRAEVAAVIDADGNYQRTVVRGNASVRNLRIWSADRSRYLDTALNPEGDLNGDLWPVVLENPADDNHPWVVWSRFNGEDYDLAWSRWTSSGWTPIAWLTSEVGPAGEYDPSIDFDLDDGRPYVAWWQDDDGIGQVYFSLYLVSEWSAPFRVSEPGVDSRGPRVTVEDDDRIIVEYDTPHGSEVRTIKFQRPLTITDDLDPLDLFSSQPVGPLGPRGAESGN